MYRCGSKHVGAEHIAALVRKVAVEKRKVVWADKRFQVIVGWWSSWSWASWDWGPAHIPAENVVLGAGGVWRVIWQHHVAVDSVCHHVDDEIENAERRGGAGRKENTATKLAWKKKRGKGREVLEREKEGKGREGKGREGKGK